MCLQKSGSAQDLVAAQTASCTPHQTYCCSYPFTAQHKQSWVPLWAFVPYSCTSAVRPHLPPGTSWQRKTCRKPRRQVQMNMGILIAKLHLRPVTSYSGIANCPGERVFWAPTYPKPKWSVLAGAVFPPQNG